MERAGANASTRGIVHRFGIRTISLPSRPSNVLTSLPAPMD